MSEQKQVWIDVHYPIQPSDPLPPERKVVLVWLAGYHLPFCGYVRYASGDDEGQYFVVYHGNRILGNRVVSWCDCLPNQGPELDEARMYSSEQASGRGFPARQPAKGGDA